MKNIIELTNISKNYGHKTALNIDTLTVQENEIFGFVGTNDAGETTTINLFLNFKFPS